MHLGADRPGVDQGLGDGVEAHVFRAGDGAHAHAFTEEGEEFGALRGGQLVHAHFNMNFHA